MNMTAYGHAPRRRALATALLALIATPAFAGTPADKDPKTLDAVVVTAAGFEQKITEAPASISVITREDLQQKRYNILAQALGDVEGIDIGQGTGKTGGLNISIRGMPSQYTLILMETLIKATLPGFFVREAATPKFASS